VELFNRAYKIEGKERERERERERDREIEYIDDLPSE
jgi:hypothetical protein